MSKTHHPVAPLSLEDLRERCGWVETDSTREWLEAYLDRNVERMRETLLHVPPAIDPRQRVLDVGCYGLMLPWYVDILGYRNITGVAHEPNSFLNERTRKVKGVTDFSLEMRFFNVEEDSWPFENDSFDIVFCFEVLEHMSTDPMHLMGELNRVLRPNGVLVLTTPNSASWASLSRAMLGEQPYNFTPFYGVPGWAHRHNREYTPHEVARLAEGAGLEIIELITLKQAKLSLSRMLVSRLGGLIGILCGRSPISHRGQIILVSARKAGPVRDRWPRWLYIDPVPLAESLKRVGPKGQRRLDEWR